MGVCKAVRKKKTRGIQQGGLGESIYVWECKRYMLVTETVNGMWKTSKGMRSGSVSSVGGCVVSISGWDVKRGV